MQGFNMGRYYAPDDSDPPKFNTGSSAKKANPGVQTVRFEIPFAVCCQTCDPETIIGQGVRFNAQKSRVGHFYSTPIWGFRIKHVDCGGWIQINTDPENAEYVVAEGGRRQYPARADDEGESLLGPRISTEEKKRRQGDGFAALEGKVQDQEQAKAEHRRIIELYNAQERDWNDLYTANQRVRRYFRQERKVNEAKAADRKRIQDKIGWDGEILDLTREDELVASIAQYGSLQTFEEDILDATLKPLNMSSKKGVSESSRSQSNHVSKLVRLSTDPFLSQRTVSKRGGDPIFASLKRKRQSSEIEPDPTAEMEVNRDDERSSAANSPRRQNLVSYGSDDDDVD